MARHADRRAPFARLCRRGRACAPACLRNAALQRAPARLCRGVSVASRRCPHWRAALPGVRTPRPPLQRAPARLGRGAPPSLSNPLQALY